MKKIEIGMRVEAGDGEEHDTGTVDSLSGEMAVVRWDSGVTTPCPLSELEELEVKP